MQALSNSGLKCNAYSRRIALSQFRSTSVIVRLLSVARELGEGALLGAAKELHSTWEAVLSTIIAPAVGACRLKQANVLDLPTILLEQPKGSALPTRSVWINYQIIAMKDLILRSVGRSNTTFHTRSRGQRV